MNKSITVFALLVIVFFLTTCNQDKYEWTNWRGPNSNGITTESDWNPAALDTNNIIWTTNVGKGHAEILVKGNKCYITGWNMEIEGDDTNTFTSIFCLNTNNGSEVWRRDIEIDSTRWTGPRSTPALDNSKLYNLLWDGRLMCLNAKNGNTIWEKDIYADSLADRHFWGFVTSIVIKGNMLLLNAGSNGLALDKSNGNIIWKSDKKGSSLLSPVILTYRDRTVGAFHHDTVFNLVDISNGEVLTTYIRKPYVNGDPIPFDNKLFLYKELIDLSTETPTQLWRQRPIRPHFSDGFYSNGYVYMINRRRGKTHLACLDMANGEFKWEKELNDWGGLVAAGDKMIIHEGKGKVMIADINPEEYVEISSAQILEEGDTRPYFCWTTPILVNGKLYVRNYGGNIACVNMKN